MQAKIAFDVILTENDKLYLAEIDYPFGLVRASVRLSHEARKYGLKPLYP